VLDFWGRLLRLGDSFFFPKDSFNFQALDADLASPVESFADPHYTCACALNAPLQQDLVSGAEIMSGGVDTRSCWRNIERANVRRFSRRQKIYPEGNDDGATL
jgi:hypothetical protein